MRAGPRTSSSRHFPCPARTRCEDSPLSKALGAKPIGKRMQISRSSWSANASSRRFSFILLPSCHRRRSEPRCLVRSPFQKPLSQCCVRRRSQFQTQSGFGGEPEEIKIFLSEQSNREEAKHLRSPGNQPACQMRTALPAIQVRGPAAQESVTARPKPSL